MKDNAAPVRRGRPVLRRIAAGAGLVMVIAAAAAFAFRDAAARGILGSVAHGLGYDYRSASLDVNLGRAIARDVRIRNVAGEPVLEAREIDVAYSLRDLLPGGKRLFGLKSITVDAPHLTVIHHADGSYNITLPGVPQGPAAAHPPPLDARLLVTAGAVDLIDRFVAPPRERRERLGAIHADGIVSPAAGSFYHAGAVLEDGAARYPIVGNARFEDPRGFEFAHWTAARLPLAALANFALSSHAIVFEAGELRSVDFRLGALAGPAGTLQPHLGMSAQLAGGRVALAALAKPIRDARGAFVVDDDSATVRSLDAALNGIPLHVSGALYHFAAPQVAFALTARGNLENARALSNLSAKLPLAGAIALQGLAEGPASNPLVLVRLRSPQVTYGTYRLAGARGFLALRGNRLDVLSAGVRYGPVAVAGRAAVQLLRHTQTAGYLTLAAPAAALPYVGNVLPGVVLRGLAAGGGSDAGLAARGYLGGADGPDRLDVPFALGAGGGTVGPVVLQRRDGASLYARAAFDRERDRTVAIVDARRLSLLPAPAVTLPGISLPPPPRVDAKLDAALAGIAVGSKLARASGELHAYGSWGDLRADAAATAAGAAAAGRLRGSFERLVPFTGNIGARGGIDVPFALTSDGRSTVVQIRYARFPGARIDGLELRSASATLGVRPPAVDLYAADVRFAGTRITAAGSFGAGGHVHLTAGDVDLSALRAAGVPVSGGRATLIADVGGSIAKPAAALRAAVSGARYAGGDVGADVGLAYDGAALRIERATLTYAGAYASASGSVSGLAPGRIAPRYDLRARLEDADIATLAQRIKNPLRYPAGTLDADVRVGGAGAAPTVDGEVRIPEGSLNGLSLRDARVAVAGSASALTARGGRVTVGGTTMTFAGAASRARQSLRLRSERVNLADFNDYFDEADVLAGMGRFALAFDAAPRALDASADVALRGTRYRRFDLGSIDARIHTAGTTVRVDASLAGTNGRARLVGSAGVPADAPRHDIVRRSSLDLQAQLAGIDLGNVLPAAGLSLPIVGKFDGSATIRGRYPALALSARAALTNGYAGRVPIQRFTLAASAANGRGRLTDATLVAAGVSADVRGTFGLRPADAFDLQARASTADIDQILTTASGKNPGLKGALATRAQLTGTLARPQLKGSVDATDVSYSAVTIPALHAEVSATRSALELRNGSVALPSGTIGFDGRVPLGGGGGSTPIAFDFAPRQVDVAPFAPLFGDGSVVKGIFDGDLGLRGTLAAPQLSGNLALTGGSYRSNTLTSPLTGIEGQLDVSGTTVRIARLHAHAAPGDIDAAGTLAVRDLRDPVRGLTAGVNVTLAGARIAAPKYFTGSVDGSIAVRKSAGAAVQIGGGLTFSGARIPYTALLPSGGSARGNAPALPDAAFDVGVTAGRDVRVQSGPVDIGATGMARLAGTLANPTLAGKFVATDGSVSLYRTFTVQSGSSVNFNPSDGITPSVDATAVTNIDDPPTNVLLRITGLATHLQLAFSSEPAYSQQQILGLLVNAQALGAVSGVAQSSGANNGVSIAGIGAGVLNTQLTQRFLQPLSSKLGGALGLSDLNVNYSTNGAVSANARRRISKNVSFTYGEQIGGPTPRTSVGINIGNEIAGAQLTFYQAAGSQQAFGGQALTPFLQSGFLATSPPNYTLEAIEPPNGSGFVFSYQRRYW